MNQINPSLQQRRFFKVIGARLMPLLRMPAFWSVTFIGNGFVAAGAAGFYFFEKEAQIAPLTALDSISWSIGLVTTVGYGNLTPLTPGGKIVGIFMMLGGSLFLWSYMALLVGVLLAPDISLIERELKGIKRESSLDERKLDEVLAILARMEERK